MIKSEVLCSTFATRIVFRIHSKHGVAPPLPGMKLSLSLICEFEFIHCTVILEVDDFY